MIARSPAHLWHVTSADILERLQVEDPWITLCLQFLGSGASPVSSRETPSLEAWRNLLTASYSRNPLATDPPARHISSTPLPASAPTASRNLSR